MNSLLKEKLDEFIVRFNEEPCVRQFVLVREQIDSSSYLQELREKIKKSQKEMALSMGDSSYKDKKKAYLAYKREYDDNPLIINYNYLQEEVYYLLKELQDKLKEKER